MFGVKKNKIEFIDASGQIAPNYYPVPAKKMLPEWYKKLESYPAEHKDLSPLKAEHGTVKKCSPFLDSITSGYFILSHLDIHVSEETGPNGDHTFYWPSSMGGRAFDSIINGHIYKQVKGYPGIQEDQTVPKFANPWIIQTPKGYSSLICAPMHHDLPIHPLEAIVDTDTYHNPVEFPFYLKDPEFSGVIPAGTPIVQVIPFKRDEWVSESRIQNEEDIKNHKHALGKLNSVFVNRYRKLFWERKKFN